MVVRFVPGFLEPFFLRGGEWVGGDDGVRLALLLIFARGDLLILVLDKAVLSLDLFMLAAAVSSDELMFVTDTAAGYAKEKNILGDKLKG